MHFVRCQAPPGALLMSSALPKAACMPASGIGLKVTSPLQLFNKLCVLWRPSAKLDNERAQVSQTWPLPSQS